MKNLILIVLKHSGTALLVVFICMSLLNGLSSFALLSLINHFIYGSQTSIYNQYGPYLFFIFLIVSYLGSVVLQNLLLRYSSNLSYNLEMSLLKKITESSYESFIDFGTEKMYTCLADAAKMNRTAEVMIGTLNFCVLLLFCILYLLWISFSGGVVIIIIISILIGLYVQKNKRNIRMIYNIRNVQDNYYYLLQDLMQGIKQFKTSIHRRKVLLERYITVVKKDSKEKQLEVDKRYIKNQFFATYSWYLLLGFVSFALPTVLHLSLQQIAAFLTTILFILTPISGLINSIPQLNLLRLSLDRIIEAEKALSRIDTSTDQTVLHHPTSFNAVDFEDINYSYQHDKNDFAIRIDKLSLQIGDIVFLVGPNGSGKTTFLYILCGLIQPHSGNIYIDREKVSWSDYIGIVANGISTVFIDQISFENNYDQFDLSEQNEELEKLLKIFNLSHIKTVDYSKNKFIRRLSQGEQKRLALVKALLEDKPILILDEWSANQDPVNKELFYSSWIDYIKKIGKTLIVITHERDQFLKADKVIDFEYGSIKTYSAR